MRGEEEGVGGRGDSGDVFLSTAQVFVHACFFFFFTLCSRKKAPHFYLRAMSVGSLFTSPKSAASPKGRGTVKKKIKKLKIDIEKKEKKKKRGRPIIRSRKNIFFFSFFFFIYFTVTPLTWLSMD